MQPLHEPKSSVAVKARFGPPPPTKQQVRAHPRGWALLVPGPTSNGSSNGCRAAADHAPWTAAVMTEAAANVRLHAESYTWSEGIG